MLLACVRLKGHLSSLSIFVSHCSRVRAVGVQPEYTVNGRLSLYLFVKSNYYRIGDLIRKICGYLIQVGDNDSRNFLSVCSEIRIGFFFIIY